MDDPEGMKPLLTSYQGHPRVEEGPLHLCVLGGAGAGDNSASHEHNQHATLHGMVSMHVLALPVGTELQTGLTRQHLRYKLGLRQLVPVEPAAPGDAAWSLSLDARAKSWSQDKAHWQVHHMQPD